MLHVGKQGSSSSSESSPSREVSPLNGVIEDMQSRIKRLERWHIINTVCPLLSTQKFLYFDYTSISLGITFLDLNMFYSPTQSFWTGAMDIFYVRVCWLFALPEKTPVVCIGITNRCCKLKLFFHVTDGFSLQSWHLFIQSMDLILSDLKMFLFLDILLELDNWILLLE